MERQRRRAFSGDATGMVLLWKRLVTPNVGRGFDLPSLAVPSDSSWDRLRTIERRLPL
jgi:hypothetical protein